MKNGKLFIKYQAIKRGPMHGEQLLLFAEELPTQLTINYEQPANQTETSCTENKLAKFVLDAWREAQV